MKNNEETFNFDIKNIRDEVKFIRNYVLKNINQCSFRYDGYGEKNVKIQPHTFLYRDKIEGCEKGEYTSFNEDEKTYIAFLFGDLFETCKLESSTNRQNEFLREIVKTLKSES